MNLIGRLAEREALDRLLAEARAGRSRALVIHAEAGMGKTALLEYARSVAQKFEFRVQDSVGLQAETQFAFGAIHQICAPLLGALDALPEPQQTALRVAFGQQTGAPPDRFLIGLGMLTLLAEAAEERPLLCVVDDAQWLDEASAQVLGFVARRIAAEDVALLLSVRDPTDDGDLQAFSGLPELRVAGLHDHEARALLTASVPTPLDDGVRDRVVAEARGNPLALLELPRSVTPAQWAGGFELPDAMSVPHRVEDGFRQRSSGLPTETQLLLLLAAAEPTGDAAMLWRAAEELGIDVEAAGPAEDAGLLEIDTQVRFRHPLVRSAVYRARSEADRRRVHGALAAVTDPESDADRRAWHRARAAKGTDEGVAAELQRSAGRARDRGGVAAAAAFLQQAAELTPDPARRAARALEAAQAKHESGASETALELLTVAAAGPLDALQAARVELLHAQIAFHLTRDVGVPRMLLAAARTLAPLDAAMSRETYLHALDAAVITGGDVVLDIAQAALTAPPPVGLVRPVDQLLDGLATSMTRGHVQGVPALRRALEAFRDTPRTGSRHVEDSDRWLWLAARNAVAVLDEDILYVLASRNVQGAREAGALASLPAALSFLSITSVLLGELARADELAAEAATITRDTGGVQLRHAQVILSAWRGHESETTELTGIIARDLAYPDEGTDASLAQYALAVLYNGLGDYPAAKEAAAQACESHEMSLGSAGLPELVEACAGSGDLAGAGDALNRFSERAHATGTRWALGLAARSRGLVSSGPDAEDHYREAIEHLDQSRMVTYLARTHLTYGEWLRREGRQHDAREHLNTAHDLLSDMGAEAFAARAARELRATGKHPRKRTAQPTDALTPHELQIARLVATGATSREVAAHLFLSPRTIEAHLRNIFSKLGITSRRQLKDLRLT